MFCFCCSWDTGAWLRDVTLPCDIDFWLEKIKFKIYSLQLSVCLSVTSQFCRISCLSFIMSGDLEVWLFGRKTMLLVTAIHCNYTISRATANIFTIVALYATFRCRVTKFGWDGQIEWRTDRVAKRPPSGRATQQLSSTASKCQPGVVKFTTGHGRIVYWK